MDVGLAPALAPPPRSPQTASIYSGDSSPRVVNPFETGADDDAALAAVPDGELFGIGKRLNTSD